MSDLYSVLGVQKGATQDDIKKAYRKMALLKHPDRGGDKEEFQKLQKANEVLSDPDKRAFYDSTGKVPGEDGAHSQGQGAGAPVDLSEIFGSMFGGGVGMPGGFPFFGGMGRPGGNGKAPRGPNKLHEIGVGLADLYHGKSFKLNMKRDSLCGPCDGKGGTAEKCTACGGRGMRMRAQQMGPMMTMTHEPCNTCQQTGHKIIDACKVCTGKRVIEKEVTLDVVLDPGMQEGDRIVFEGQCSESHLYEKPGDVILVIRAATTDDDTWVRRGNELVTEIQLTLAESLLGWARTFNEHPSGRPLHIVWKEGVIRDGEILRVPEWGMPVRGANGRKGDLRIVCRVNAQESLTEDQKNALKGVWLDWIEPIGESDVSVHRA
jgi:DnaJ family protein A protein 2